MVLRIVKTPGAIIPSIEVFSVTPSLLIFIAKIPIKKAEKFCKKIKIKNGHVPSVPTSKISIAIKVDPIKKAPKKRVIIDAL